MNVELKNIIDVAKEAGEKILEIYNSSDFEIEIKKDQSPLTSADKASHEFIKYKLNQLFPGIPVLSEEGKIIPYSERRNWEKFWMVDPLDGTKEFIKQNGEFTVNIALIENNKPAAGVIYAPAMNLLYYGSDLAGSFKSFENKLEKLDIRNDKIKNEITVARSRSHSSKEEEEYFRKFKVGKTINAGSSLKFGLIAEGRADIYFRFGPTWEWDTAAGHAIVKFAGGNVIDFKGNTELCYNKEILLNDSFICKTSWI